MREEIRDKDRILHIYESIQNIEEFIRNKSFEDFSINKILKFTLYKNIEIIGEAAFNLTKELIEKYPEVPWQIIIKQRHVLVHGYYQIDDEIFWKH